MDCCGTLGSWTLALRGRPTPPQSIPTPSRHVTPRQTMPSVMSWCQKKWCVVVGVLGSSRNGCFYRLFMKPECVQVWRVIFLFWDVCSCSSDSHSACCCLHTFHYLNDSAHVQYVFILVWCAFNFLWLSRCYFVVSIFLLGSSTIELVWSCKLLKAGTQFVFVAILNVPTELFLMGIIFASSISVTYVFLYTYI